MTKSIAVNKTSILIVEDNPGDARFVAELLKNSGSDAFNLTAVDRIEDALEKLKDAKFDVVLLDLNLPDSYGLKGLEKIARQHPDLPVIVLTGTDDEDLGLQAIHLHASDYLSKGKIETTLLVRTLRYAIERKKREQELQQLNRTLKALSNSSQAMMRAKDEPAYLNEVCQIIVNDRGHAMVWIGLAEADEARTVRPVAQAGFENGYLKTLNVTWNDTERGRGPTGKAIRTGKPAVCRNMLTDPDFKPWREEAIKRGYASSLVLPLSAHGKTFGAINIYSREPDAFSEDEIKLLGELADDLAYGITAIRLRAAHQQAENALQQSKDALQKSHGDLEKKVRERTAELSKTNKDLKIEITERKRMAAEMEKYQERLRALAASLTSTEERERRRIASQIHDTVIQTLSLSNIKMGALYKELADARLEYSALKLKEIRSTIEEAIGESRSLMAELTPHLLYELGLVPAINDLVQKLQKRHNVPIQFKDDGQPKMVDKTIKGILFQATRELIMNAMKHAGKCAITVTLSRKNDQLRICVEDNGSGFDVPEEGRFVFRGNGGFGLFTIRERLEGIGGRLDIRSQAGAGTSASLLVPLA